MAFQSREQSELSALSDVYEATRAVGLSDSLDELVDDVLDRAQDLIGFEHCALMLHDRTSGELTVERVRGYGDKVDEIRGMTIEMGDGISGWAAEQRSAARVGDVREDPRYIQGLPEARSNLAVPLVVGNEVAGVINVESERTHAFTEEHEMLLTVLGAQAALAILAARARRRLRDRIRHLDALFRISRLASREQDLDETLRRILDITAEITPEGQVAILLLNEDDDLEVRAAEGYRESVSDLTIPLGKGTTGRCASRGETVVVDDVRSDARYIPGVSGGRSEIAVPLRVEDRVIGVLDAEATVPGAFGEEEERTLSVVAQQVAAVVHTIQLHERTREMAVTDPLTGLHNRRYFIAGLENHLRRAERYDEELALLLLDCDDLKRVNDEYGHYCGDRALELVAELLRRCLRDSDETARLGGDEFACLLLNADERLARRATARLRDGFATNHIESDSGESIDVSVSMGVALYPRDAGDVHELMRKADDALYRAKRRGAGELEVFEEAGRLGGAAGSGDGIGEAS